MKFNTKKTIERDSCPCCGGGGQKKAFDVRYEDLFCGLVEDFVYVQKIYFCEECNMIYTKNPISTEIFDRHYKRMSRYESTEYVGKEDYSLHTMYERQFDFINQTIEDYESVLEIGASTGESTFL